MAKEHEVSIGCKVRIDNVDEIAGGKDHWSNGDIVKIIDEDETSFWAENTKGERDYWIIDKGYELTQVTIVEEPKDE